MSLNFLDNACKELDRSDTRFGLCDNQDGTKAYSNTENPERWIATVINDKALILTFTPVDKCLMQDNDYPDRRRCDGILTSTEHLYFIELKDQAKRWITDAIEQLESTVEIFKDHHDIHQFRHKKAFACNKQQRHFQEIDNELNIAFFRKHRVRLDIQADILMVD